MMTQTIDTQDADQRVEVVASEHGGVVRRQEVVRDVSYERQQALTQISQFIWLLFGALEALIALRIFLKLIAANPANPFARLVYGLTDLFLWPFFGLTV